MRKALRNLLLQIKTELVARMERHGLLCSSVALGGRDAVGRGLHLQHGISIVVGARRGDDFVGTIKGDYGYIDFWFA